MTEEITKEETKRKIYLIVGIVLIITLILAIYAWPATTGNVVETSHVKIGYISIINALPLYVALEKGYFEQAGIQVEAIKVDSPQLLIDSAVAKQTDFLATGAATGITSIVDYQNPGELKIFALVGEYIESKDNVLIVKKDSKITSLKELEGKKLAILPGIQFKTIAKHILTVNNVNLSKVEIVEIAPNLQVQVLASGQVDAVLGLEPVRTIAIQKGIARDLVVSPASTYIVNPVYLGAGVVRGDFAQENPKTTEKVISVFEKAIAEINANPEESKQYLAKYTALDANLTKNINLPLFVSQKDIGEKEINDLQKFIDIFTTYKVIDGRVDAKNLILEQSK